MKILVSNPTSFFRSEVVLFGVQKNQTLPSGAEVLHEVPGATIATAKIMVPPMRSGYQELEPLPVEPWDWGDDSEHTIAQNSMMSVVHLWNRERGLVDHAILYQGAGEPWVRFQLIQALESLESRTKEVDVSPDAIIKFLPPGDWHIVNRMDSSKTLSLRDKQAVQWQGYAVNRGEIDQEDLKAFSTIMAISEWDLDVAGDWRSGWGPWNTIPSGAHPDRSNDFDLLAHRGVILNTRPGDTGDQLGFGRWKHLDIISQGNGFALSQDKFAIGQEVCRLIWHFEPDGSLPTPEAHPQYKSWSETFNWNANVSPDRFRRTYYDSGWYEGWLGMDEEHYTCAYLKERVFLSGDFMAHLILRMKSFHLKTQGRWPNVGRAVGRLGMGAVDCYQATGDEALLKEIKDTFIPSIKTEFQRRNGEIRLNPNNNPRSLRIINGDPHTGIPGDEWVVWEDAQAVGAMDALWQLTNDPELKIMTWQLAKSIVHHGLDSRGKILKAIKWNGPDAPVGPEEASSDGSDYHSWGYDAWAVAARLALEFSDVDTAEKAAAAGVVVRDGTYLNRFSYLAPAP